MPYKSRAQARYMHAAAARGEIRPSVVKDFDKATKGKFKDLPEKVEKKASMLAELMFKAAAVSDAEAKEYGAFRSQALAGTPRARAALAGARKVKKEHPVQYYLNPLVPGPITHGLSALRQRVAATAAGAPIRSALAVGGGMAAGALAGNMIGGSGQYGSSINAATAQGAGQLAGGLAGAGILAAMGNKKRQAHAQELYDKVLKKHEA